MKIRKLSSILLSILLLTNCRLNELTQETTPSQWCSIRPCVDMGGFIFNEPLGSFLVFLLAILWILSGVYFLRDHKDQISRKLFGIALVLGGIGAAEAGISYQAFSYELKCAGRENCLLTNAFEVGYSLTQTVSVSFMLSAVAFACLKGVMQKGMVIYSVINSILYIGITMIGVTEPNKLLLSFEILMLFALPGILFVLLISMFSYIKSKSALDGSLFLAAIFLIIVNVAYFSYYAAGITAMLYQGGQGFYFSENDVLHVGMILWLMHIVLYVGKHLKDIEPKTI